MWLCWDVNRPCNLDLVHWPGSLRGLAWPNYWTQTLDIAANVWCYWTYLLVCCPRLETNSKLVKLNVLVFEPVWSCGVYPKHCCHLQHPNVVLPFTRVGGGSLALTVQFGRKGMLQITWKYIFSFISKLISILLYYMWVICGGGGTLLS